MKKWFGFTLAEVLITVGALGVVAALTLPNIKLAYSKKVTLAQLQKTYSYMANTIEMSEYHNGKVKRWDLDMPAKNIFEKYFKNYMKYALEMPSSQLELPEEERKFLNGEKVSGSTGTAGYVGKTYKKGVAENQQGYHIIMMDGSMISLFTYTTSSERVLYVIIDTNGESSPNTVGKDMFIYTLTKSAGLIPLGDCKGPLPRACTSDPRNIRKWYNGTAPEAPSSQAPCTTANSNYRGLWCAALIMLDGWRMEKDYPWGKH